MSSVAELSRLPGDWYHGHLPANVMIEPGAHVETSYSFLRFRSAMERALIVRAGAALYAPILDVGPEGRIEIGEHALISSAMIVCDREVTIGPMTMLAWSATIIDSYRGWCGPGRNGAGTGAEPRPVHIGANVWLGFESCVLPGVTIGQGSVVAARAVVVDDVPPNCIVAGNPAKVVRKF